MPQGGALFLLSGSQSLLNIHDQGAAEPHLGIRVIRLLEAVSNDSDLHSLKVQHGHQPACQQCRCSLFGTRYLVGWYLSFQSMEYGTSCGRYKERESVSVCEREGDTDTHKQGVDSKTRHQREEGMIRNQETVRQKHRDGDRRNKRTHKWKQCVAKRIFKGKGPYLTIACSASCDEGVDVSSNTFTTSVNPFAHAM